MNTGTSKHRIRQIMLIATLVFASTGAMAADNVYVKVVGAVQDWIIGDSTVDSLDRTDHIEATEYHHLMEIPEGGSAIDHQTVIMTKRIDRSSAQLFQAMDTSEQLTEVLFRFFRPNPSGDGTTQEYLNVTLTGARIVSIEPLSPDTLTPETAARPFTERIRFSYGTILCEYLPTGSSHMATAGGH